MTGKSFCHLYNRLARHTGFTRSMIEGITLYTTIKFKFSLAIAQGDIKLIINKKLTVVDNILATSSIFVFSSMIMTIINPCTIITINKRLISYSHLSASSIQHVTRTFNCNVTCSNIERTLVNNLCIVIENMKSVFACNSSLIIDNTISIRTSNTIDNNFTAIVHHYVC